MIERSEIVSLGSGRDVYLRSWQPETIADRAVLYLHGVESHSDWFAKVAQRLAAAGVAVYAFDRFGWGKRPGPRGHLVSADAAVADIDGILQLVARQHASVGIVGMSWGGLLALYYAFQKPSRVDCLTLIAPGIIPRRALSLWSQMQIMLAYGFFPNWRLNLRLQPEDFTSVAHWQMYVASDANRVTAVSAAFCLATRSMRQAVLRSLQQKQNLPPTSVLLAGNDTIVNNLASIEALRHEQVRVLSYENAAHSLIFEDPARVARDVLRLVQAVPILRQKLA